MTDAGAPSVEIAAASSTSGCLSASTAPVSLLEVAQDAKIIVNIASGKVSFICFLPCFRIRLQAVDLSVPLAATHTSKVNTKEGHEGGSYGRQRAT